MTTNASRGACKPVVFQIVIMKQLEHGYSHARNDLIDIQGTKGSGNMSVSGQESERNRWKRYKWSETPEQREQRLKRMKEYHLKIKAMKEQRKVEK